MTGAALRDILEDSRSAKCCILQYKSSPRWDREGRRSGGCEMKILSSDIVGLFSNRLSIGGTTSRSFR